MTKQSNYISVTEIVSICYCEQKMVFDAQYGQRRTRAVQKLADQGIREHKRFEDKGRRLAAGDRRCFIATAVYGASAAETDFLRAWRDRSLMPSRVGRGFIASYYFISPYLVSVVRWVPGAERVARGILNFVLRRLGWQA